LLSSSGQEFEEDAVGVMEGEGEVVLYVGDICHTHH